jgi:hypothetical protein
LPNSAATRKTPGIATARAAATNNVAICILS